jgi:hypothetical protein
MDRKLVILALAGALLLAGCSGGSGGTPEASDGTGTAAPMEATAGEHPAVTDGRLDVSIILQDHLTVLRGAESFTILNNRTATYVENGSVSGRSVLINKADIANQRQRLESRSFTPDGDIQTELVRFGNATTTCTLRSGESDCSDGGISTRRIMGSTVETTSLETLGAPEFRPDGIADREGQSVYRYSASAFRTSMGSETSAELYGTDPTLVKATLLVHPNGHIVEYSLTYQTGGDTPQELDLTYVTTAINATTFEPYTG